MSIVARHIGHSGGRRLLPGQIHVLIDFLLDDHDLLQVFEDGWRHATIRPVHRGLLEFVTLHLYSDQNDSGCTPIA